MSAILLISGVILTIWGYFWFLHDHYARPPLWMLIIAIGDGMSIKDDLRKLPRNTLKAAVNEPGLACVLVLLCDHCRDLFRCSAAYRLDGWAMTDPRNDQRYETDKAFRAQYLTEQAKRLDEQADELRKEAARYREIAQRLASPD